MKSIAQLINRCLHRICYKKKQDILFDRMLVNYKRNSQVTEAIDKLEQSLKCKVYTSPNQIQEDFSYTLEAAILSLKGWLLAFSVVALLLLILSFNRNFQSQARSSFDEVLTYNAEGIEAAEGGSLNLFILPIEQEYGH
jgi:hypothetical protein